MKQLIKHLLLALTLFVFGLSLKAQDTLQISEKSFVNLSAKGGEGEAKLQWTVDYKQLGKVQNVIIRYQRKIEKGKPYKYSEVLDAKSTEVKIKELKEAESYVWNIGALKDGSDISKVLVNGEPKSEEMIWSDKGKFETDRSWGIFKFLVLIGSLGLFIFGMKQMSEGLQQMAGGGLRKILSGMTANRYLGVLSGFLITALVQSSSATTVMTVSFVNAGLLTLLESAGVMMGANIGTTITGWLVSVFGFKISVDDYSLIFIAIGAPLLFINKVRTKAWANSLIGFALLFMGLGLLKDAVPELSADSPIIGFFTKFSDYGIWGRLMFVLLGTLVTVVIQSSSAAMALTLALVLKGIIPFEVAAAMILGENIGTTITAELASLVGNVHAKRSARIHSMFNIIGVAWMVIALPLFVGGISYVMTTSFGVDPNVDHEGATLALSAFHTVFNLSNVLILIWFVPWLVRVAEKTVPSKGEDDEIFKLEHIQGGLTETPELSILEASREVTKFGELTLKMSKKVNELLNEKDAKKRAKLMKKITKYEDITDNLESEIFNYLSKVSQSELSDKSSNELRAMLSATNDLERIGDIFYTMGKSLEKKNDAKIWFDQNQREAISDLNKIVDEAFAIMLDNLNAGYGNVKIEKAVAKEKEINELRDKLRKKHLKSIEKGDYHARAGLVYSNLFSSLERIGDHIINVSEAVSGINLN